MDHESPESAKSRVQEHFRRTMETQDKKEETFRENARLIRVAVFNAPYPGLTQKHIFATFEAQGIASRTISIVLDDMVHHKVAAIIGKRNNSSHSYYVAPFTDEDDEDGTSPSDQGIATDRVRRPLSPELKDQVWSRTKGHCAYCGVPLLPFSSFTIDHIHPFSDGGSDAYDNLFACCKTCNSRKHSMPIETFRQRCGGGPFWFERNGGAA